MHTPIPRIFGIGSLASAAAVALLAFGCTPASPSVNADASVGTGGHASGTGGGTTAASGGTTGAGTGGETPAGTGGTAGTGSGGNTSGTGGAATGTGGTTTTGTGGKGGTTAATGGAGGKAAGTGGAASGTGGKGGTTAASGGAGGGAINNNTELYDPTKFPRFDITLPQASITALNTVTGPDDAKQNTYVTADFAYGTEKVTNIGLRIKGEGSFRKLDKKSAFKIKFDEFVPNQAFRGLHRMSFNNMIEDPSFVAERLAYDVFRKANLPAPRANSALVYVNNTLYGVYTNIEAEDKTFIKRWFTDDSGNLYEEGQKDFVTGAETAFDLETNETANDRTDLKNLISIVQTAASATFATQVDAALDMTHWMRFTAAEAAVNQWDMYSYTVFYINNFRIYHNPTSNKFQFIPWGMDLSMKPFRDSGKPHIKIFDLAREGDFASGKITAGIVFQKCIASPDCKTKYTAAVREIVGMYEGMNLATVAQTYFDQIKTQVYADPRKEYTQAQIDAGFQSVLKTIRERPAAIRADIGP
jgi:spore coat protein CotH